MICRVPCQIFSAILLVFVSCQPGVTQDVDFNRDIRPLLSDRCFMCHGPDADSREADLRFDHPVGDESPLAKRDSGNVITPGDLKNSSLWERLITDDDDLKMPPPDSNKRALSDNEKELVKKWILSGANFETHWSFSSPQKPTPKKVKAGAWNQQPIDQFVYAKLMSRRLKPKNPADKRTLIRRLYFDLIGLPPSPQQIEEFLKDESDLAYEKLVDKLLSQKSYGEHMARYWLDLVRFADTNGIHHDHFREVTPYRDWVIDSFNNNLPFDKFVEYQIAGDLFPNPSTEQLIASGFNRLHLIIDRGTALPEESFHRNVVDRVTAFGTVFMGLTVGCAQCHEHKYDPISQKEFFGLYAFFNNIDAAPETPGRNRHPPFISVPTPQQQQSLQTQNAKLKLSEKKVRELQKLIKNLNADNVKARQQLENELKSAQGVIKDAQGQIAAINKSAPTTLIMKERNDIRETRMRIRGVYDQLGEKVERGTPGFLPPLKSASQTPTRFDLAKWVTDPGHPLTARVAVNRIWQQLFGVGLVKTSEDFGAQGDTPSHPKLLDYLAIRFIESDWNVKALVKDIVMSETYRQSSAATTEEFNQDKDNRNLARGARFRLDAETIRDQILLVSGLLNPEMYGPSVKPPQPPNLWKSVSMVSSSTFAFKADSGDKIRRRSLYSFWKRAMPPPQMTIFDAPTRESCISRRERTNTPLQALVLMNEAQYFAAAKNLSLIVLGQMPSDSQRIDYLYESLTSQRPDQKEKEILLNGLAELKQNYAEDAKLTQEITAGLKLDAKLNKVDVAAYTTLINSLFNLDITKTRD